MLTDLKSLIENLKAFDWDLELKNIVSENTKAIEDLQREQMASGKTSTGEMTSLEGRGYADVTKAYKRMVGVGLGSVIDRVTGYQSGNLYNEVEAVVSGDQFEVSSGVPYFADLLYRTGIDWVGLNALERAKFGEEITLPMIKEVLLTKTGLQITIA